MAKKTHALALCGVLCALAVAFLWLSGVIPLSTYAWPILASATLLPAREECRKGDAGTSFIGLDAVERFEHREFGGVTCRRCNNRCQRAVVAFGDGSLYVTGNRCPRGGAISWDELVREVPAAEELRPQGACEAQAPGTGRDRTAAAPNLFVDREKLLFESYPTVSVSGGRDVTIGIPRVLEFWDTMPF